MEDSIKDSNDKVSSPMGVNDHPSIDFQIEQARRFHSRISELEIMCEKDGGALNWYPIALRTGDKKPTGWQSWTDREVSALSWEEVEDHIQHNRGNYGIVAVDNLESSKENEVTIVFVDYDVDENGRFKMPSSKVYENLRRFDTLTTKTRSGGYHQICAINVLEKRKFYRRHGHRNFNIRHNGMDCGEVRLNNQYVVAPGSYVPVTDEKQRAGYQGMTATGYYQVEIDKPIRFISADDLEYLQREQPHRLVAPAVV